MTQQAASKTRPEGAPEQPPAHTPGADTLADLELLLAGAYRPLTGFLSEPDVDAIERAGTLADGTPWPVPITLPVPDEIADTPGLATLTLQDPEGAPVAAVEVTQRWWRDGDWHLAGPVRRVAEPAYGAFRGLRRAPDEVAPELAGSPVLGVVVDRHPLRSDLAGIRLLAGQLGAHVLLLPLLPVARADSLVRAVLAGTAELPGSCTVVPVPLPRAHGGGEPGQREEILRAHVASAYGATHLLATRGQPGTRDTPAAPGASPLPRVTAPPVGFDLRAGTWRPAGEIPDGHRRAPIGRDELDGLLDRGEEIPEREAGPRLAAELGRARPPLSERGLTVFFTGLSGSGKSTIARGLYDALLERGDRSVTLLDGDVVRRLLSAGLTFSKTDRDRNIVRIGYVAAEVARHGGLAICAPIAPYAQTRAQVRRMVNETGDFALVHVATPLEECERRDRKGLYAKARAGVIPEFTGISDPYEEPDDAELVLDTTDMATTEAVDAVLAMLVERGWLCR